MLNIRNCAKDKIMVVVLTWGVGFSEWEKSRILERETSLFYSYLAQGIRVVIVSTSDADFVNQLDWKSRFDKFDLIFVRPNLIKSLWMLYRSRILQNIRDLIRNDLARVVVKSNQLLGAHLVIAISFFIGAQSFVRMGHSPIDQNRVIGQSKCQLRVLKFYEKLLFVANAKWEFTSKQIMQSVCGRHSKTIQFCVIPNYVDNKIWAYIQKEFDASPPHNIGFYGRFTKQKNLENLLIATAMSVNLHLTLIGDGEEKDRLIRLADNLQIADRVKFMGRLEPSMIIEQAKTWDFAILPSVVEGNPKMILEMFCAGIPVIATDVPGSGDIVKDGQTGILAKSGGVDDLHQALMYAFSLTNREVKLMIENGRKLIEKSHMINSVAMRQINYYFEDSCL